MSQVLTTPVESLEMVMPFFACRQIDLIEAEVTSVESVLLATRSVYGAPTRQNFIDPSSDDEIREEENTIEVTTERTRTCT